MSPDVPPPLPSASTISATATSGVHVVKLSGYSHAKQLLGTGEWVESAVFKVAGHSWRVKVYPNGVLEECGPGSIALFLSLAGGRSKAGVRAKFQFSLVRHGTKLASAPDRVTNAPVTFDADERDWGFEDEDLGGELLQDPEYLKDDAILIRCDITVLNSAVERRDLEALDMPREKTPPPISMRPSASTIAVTASTGSHMVKVGGYSQTKLLTGNGKYVESALFWEARHMWRIRCYPDGDREETAGHISLYLELAGEYSTNVHARFQFSLVPHDQLTTAPHGGWTGRWTFRTDNCYGFKKFMAREELEKSEYLKDDCFYVRCDVTAMNKPVAKLRDPEKLELLCHCNDADLCKNIHAPHKNKMEAEAQTLGKPRRCLGLKKMFLSCLPIRVKTSQHPVFDVEYSRL